MWVQALHLLPLRELERAGLTPKGVQMDPGGRRLLLVVVVGEALTLASLWALF